MAATLERRRFNRIMVSLPMEYHTRHPDNNIPFKGRGVLRDISLGGAYFYVDPGFSFQPGQILSLTIFDPLPYLEDTSISNLQGTGEVVRFNPRGPNGSPDGVALKFFEGPTFSAGPIQ